MNRRDAIKGIGAISAIAAAPLLPARSEPRVEFTKPRCTLWADCHRLRKGYFALGRIEELDGGWYRFSLVGETPESRHRSRTYVDFEPGRKTVTLSCPGAEAELDTLNASILSVRAI